MSVGFTPNTTNQSNKRISDINYDINELVTYKKTGETVRIVGKQEFRIHGGVYFLYRIQKRDGTFLPDSTITQSNGIPSTKLKRIVKILDRIGSNDSNNSTSSNNSTDSNSYKIDESYGGAMTKKRKSKNRKTKNRKTKNRKTKNRKSKNRKKSTYIGGTSDKGFMDQLKKEDEEEYEDLFVIKDKDKDNHTNGIVSQENKTPYTRLQNTRVFREKSSPKDKTPDTQLLNTVFREKSSQENKTPYTRLQNTRVFSSNSSPKDKTPDTPQQNTVFSSNLQMIQNGGSKEKETWNWICDNFERKVTSQYSMLNIKISTMSSEFIPDDTYATYGGIIFWHNQESGYIRNIGNQELHAIYVLIQNTQEWPAEHFRAQGQGQVHDYLYEQVMGISMNDTNPPDAACSSGFSIFHDQDKGWCIKFSSLWLNSNTRWNAIKSCGSNESKMTNQGEAIIIIGAVMQWMQSVTYGVGSYCKINYIPDQWKYNEKILEDFYWPMNSGTTSIDDPNTWYNPDNWSLIPGPARSQNIWQFVPDEYT